MSLLTCDFETYYSGEYSLSKLTTEEYIRDDRFEVIGVSVKVDNEVPVWFSGTHEETKSFLSQYDWDNSAVLCHNMLFDGAILGWKFGICPAFYYDTLCMARALHGVDAGGSLAALVVRYELGQKGTEVNDAKGKRRENFTPTELAAYGKYCSNDVELTYKLFNIMSSKFPEAETQLIDMTLRMFIQPKFYVDDAMLSARLEEIETEKRELLTSLVDKLGCCNEEDPKEAVRKKLASNKKFAQVLIDHGIDVPMKVSPRTGKNTFALAKNDEGFIALKDCDDAFIQQLCAVRLGTKSTLEETRINRFLDIAERNKGLLPIPLKYYGAHTGRWAGVDKVNFQNIPSRDKKKKALKNAIIAPPDHYVVNSDSSQIEARVLAWLAGQEGLIQQFARGEDVYSLFATKIYDKPISKETPVERFVGKTCVLGLGYGTGADKLRLTLKTTPPGVVVALEESKRIVDLYRRMNDKIVGLWGECSRALSDIMMWEKNRKPYYLGVNQAVYVDQTGIRLPNELYIRYPNLRVENSKTIYDSHKGIVNIWGGAVVENIVQALARIIVGAQMLEINSRYSVKLTVHDAAVILIPKHEIKDGIEFISKIMSTSPIWATGLPLACEVKYDESYGGC